MFTPWDDLDAIQRFAGDQLTKAKYYDFDLDFLLELEPEGPFRGDWGRLGRRRPRPLTSSEPRRRVERAPVKRGVAERRHEMPLERQGAEGVYRGARPLDLDTLEGLDAEQRHRSLAGQVEHEVQGHRDRRPSRAIRRSTVHRPAGSIVQQVEVEDDVLARGCLEDEDVASRIAA